MTKWGDRPHWRFDGVALGSDEHGTWLGFPKGTHHARPGFSFVSEVDSVTLLAPDVWALPTFHAPGIWCDLYVDIATPASADGFVMTSVDLDLDVIRVTEAFDSSQHPATAGRPLAVGDVFVDDEDEFEEHQVLFSYPPEVIALAVASKDTVLAAVSDRLPPFDGSAEAWFEVLAGLLE
jgi:hypothetical protein